MKLFKRANNKGANQTMSGSRYVARGGGGVPYYKKTSLTTFLSLYVIFSPQLISQFLQAFINGLFQRKLFSKVSVRAQHIPVGSNVFQGGGGWCNANF